MGSLKERLQNDLKEAMRSKDTQRRDTVRLLISEVKKKEIDLKADLGEGDEIQLLQGQVKQRRDSIEQFRAGGRDDLAAKEESQIEVIESYLPQQMSDDELNTFVDDGIAQTGATGPRDMGKVMGLLSKSASGRVEGRRLSEVVRTRLAELGSAG